MSRYREKWRHMEKKSLDAISSDFVNSFRPKNNNRVDEKGPSLTLLFYVWGFDASVWKVGNRDRSFGIWSSPWVKGFAYSNPRYVCFAREDYRIITKKGENQKCGESGQGFSEHANRISSYESDDWFCPSHDHTSEIIKLWTNEWILDLRLDRDLVLQMMRILISLILWLLL